MLDNSLASFSQDNSDDFDVQARHSGNSSNGSKNGSVIFDTGTVDQRTQRSSNKTTVEPGEFMAYLRQSPKQQQCGYSPPRQETQKLLDPSDLIVKNIGELSGEVYNTFKNKPKIVAHSQPQLQSHSQSHSQLHSSYDDDMDTSNEVLKEANQVYRGLFDNNLPRTRTATLARDTIPLITPEVAGLEFQNKIGKWVPKDHHVPDISTNHTVADISSSTTADTTAASATTTTTTTTTTNHEPVMNLHPTPRKPQKNNQQIEDTPLPFRFKNILPQEHSTEEQQYDESIQREELIRKLTRLIPTDDWDTITQFNGRGKNIGDITGIFDILPSLISADLSYNNIKVFPPMRDQPDQLIQLSLSHNLLNSTYFQSEGNMPALKSLSLSYNLFNDRDLTWLSHNSIFTNLQDLDLSNNEIGSLNGYPQDTLMILELNLSNNKLHGDIDFAHLIEWNQNNQVKINNTGWRRIRKLDLSGNPGIRSIRNVHLLTSLETLVLKDNISLTEISFNGICPRLSELFLDNCPNLTYMVTDTEKTFPNLNKLKVTPCFAVKSMNFPQSLVDLEIINGNITQFPSWEKFPPALQRLTIKDITGLTELPLFIHDEIASEIFFSSLQFLDLSGNSLHNWTNLLHFLPYVQLSTLILKDNPDLLIPYVSEKNRQRPGWTVREEFKEVFSNGIPTLTKIDI